jgi:hypothetical protein
MITLGVKGWPLPAQMAGQHQLKWLGSISFPIPGDRLCMPASDAGRASALKALRRAGRERNTLLSSERASE